MTNAGMFEDADKIVDMPEFGLEAHQRRRVINTEGLKDE